MCKIRLNPVNSDLLRDDIKNLMEFLKAIDECGNETKHITVTFDKLRFIHPLYGLGLAAKSNELKNRGIEIIFNNFSDVKAGSYLQTIHFPEGIELSEEHLIKKYDQKNYVPIVKFPAYNTYSSIDIRDTILAKVTNLMKNSFELDRDVFNGIYLLIAELADNISQHSDSDKGWITTQYYPRKNFIDVCIADTGKGIYKSYINQGYDYISSHKEALDNSLNGLSAKGENERGRGLISSQKMIRNGLKGVFLLYSGDALAINNDIVKTPYEWDGVLIYFRIHRNISGFNYVNYLE